MASVNKKYKKYDRTLINNHMAGFKNIMYFTVKYLNFRKL